MTDPGKMQIPSDKLLALLDACEKMLSIVSNHDRKVVFNYLTKLGHDLLDAENCSIYLALTDKGYSKPNKLRLEAYFPERSSYLPDKIEFPITSAKGQGISAYAAYIGQNMRLNAQQIDENPYVMHRFAPYLHKSRCFSTIIVPMYDRKGILLGVFKVVNKKERGRTPGPEVEFSEIDEKLMGILAKKIVGLLENLRVRQAINKFVTDMQNARNRDLTPQLILSSSKDLLRADRCELSVFSEVEKTLVFEAICCSDELGRQWLGKPVPFDWFGQELLGKNTDNLQVWNRLHEESTFTSLNFRSKSAISIRIEADEKTIGVLNIESYTQEWFDEQDEEVLRLIAHHAALAVQIMIAERNFQALVMDVFENRAQGPEEMLENILLGILESYGFDGAIFYIFQEKEKNLRCLAYLGPELKGHPWEFTHQLSDQSFACHVFNTRQVHYSANPSKDPIVSTEGIRFFNIESPILGLPLNFRDEIKGVLTIWGVNNPAPNKKDAKLLKPFAQLAAAKIAMSQYEKARDAAIDLLKKSENLYHSAFDALPVSVFRKDLLSIFTSANKAFCESLDSQEKDVLGKNDYDFFPPEVAKKYIKDDQQVLKEGKVLKKQELHKTPKMSTPISVQVIKTPVINEKGEITGLQAIFWDYSMEGRYRYLVDQSPDGIISLQKGKIILANPIAVKLLGAKSEKELLDQSILEFIHPRYEAIAKRGIELLNEQKRVKSPIEMVILDSCKKEIYVEVYSRFLPAKGEAQVVFHDLTITRSLFQEIHHRTRNNLSNILSLIKAYDKRGYNTQTLISNLRRSISAMYIVHQMFEDRKGKLSIQLSLYVERLVSALYEVHKLEDVIIELQVPPIEIGNDSATYLGLILNELVSNSIKHGAKGEKIGLHIFISFFLNKANICELIVSDNGVGFPEDFNFESDALGGLRFVRDFTQYGLCGEMTMDQEINSIQIRFPQFILKDE